MKTNSHKIPIILCCGQYIIIIIGIVLTHCSLYTTVIFINNNNNTKVVHPIFSWIIIFLTFYHTLFFIIFFLVYTILVHNWLSIYSKQIIYQPFYNLKCIKKNQFLPYVWCYKNEHFGQLPMVWQIVESTFNTNLKCIIWFQ